MLETIKTSRRQVYEWEMRQRRALRDRVLRVLGADHPVLDAMLDGEQADTIRQVVEGVFQDYRIGLDDRPFLERVYNEGQRRTGLSGWHLRFLIYYWVGRKLNKWD